MAFPAPSPARPIRVLIVDDSAFMRRAIERLLTARPGIQVVGQAADGVEGIRMALELRPDVITMDVEMPKMDGVTAVAELMKTVPTPVVMVSTLTHEGTETAIRALEAGAVECVGKPSGLSTDLANVADRLYEAVQRASVARVQRRRGPLAPVPPRPAALRPPAAAPASGTPATYVVVIGSSTGGPPALTQVVPHLPASIPAAVLIVQHMPAGFTGALARRLDSISQVPVAEAKDGELLTTGRAFVAPGDFHLLVGRDRRLRLDRGPTLHGVRPSVDLTLFSVVDTYGGAASAAILTGMGRDGADGAARLEAAGGHIVVQDEATSVVYGMPRVALEKTRNARQVPLEKVASTLVATIPARTGR
ncbi:chemotaxis response regulator protein-glutamate methylesterase [Tepidiforma sp.]|uniref:protein-glutamate methylesterase/protein-glutamine glutaminase n=1 Tax=Tepidiforma sp. TaxID=2682230 RepID=UPI002ADE292C|nr:chemotaxis response regulator protein-glutamate methylesterase [Tepidiforma sp.]